MISLLRIQSIIFKELKQLSRDRVTLGMIVIIPLIQLLLFGYAINTDVRNIPFAVVDQSNSAAARISTETVKATQEVKVVEHHTTAKQAERAIVHGRIRAALIFPSNLPERIASGKTIDQWLTDGSNTLISAAPRSHAPAGTIYI